MTRTQSLVYGPVPSRRLGRSLGVDVVPFKVCTFDCTYCQLGRTTMHTLERKIYATPAEILKQVRKRLQTAVRPDHVTIGGSGEPTLNSALGEIIAGIKGLTSVPVAVLTNGSLLSDATVRAECALADVVLPDLDAGDERTFRRINRPTRGLTLKKVVGGLEAFRGEFAGQIWLEVFLVKGVNDSKEQAEKIRRLVERIRPDKIQLNTAVRPAADSGVRRVPLRTLERLRTLLGSKAEVVADAATSRSDRTESTSRSDRTDQSDIMEEVLDMLSRRPCTLKDIADGLDADLDDIGKIVGRLRSQGKIRPIRRGSREYFSA